MIGVAAPGVDNTGSQKKSLV